MSPNCATPDENVSRDMLANPLAAPPASLGRVATWSVDVYNEATRQSTLVRQARRDDVLPLYGQIVGEAVTSYNAIWYQTDDGYVHSAWVQPVENILNPVDVAQNNFWGEVTVPFSDSRRAPNPDIGPVYARVLHERLSSHRGRDGQRRSTVVSPAGRHHLVARPLRAGCAHPPH